MYLFSGIVWWKAVSNATTFGFDGSISLQAFSTASDDGLCRGAKGIHSSIPFITSCVTKVDFLNLSPPCTTLCPIASILSIPDITPQLLLVNLDMIIF